MTTICWDGKTLAADRLALNSSLMRTTTKIRRFGNLLAGASGDLSATIEALEWVRRGRSAADWPEIQKDKDDFAALLVIDGGRILVYEKSPHPAEFHDLIFAIGSGRDFALAAMYLGKTAAEAIEVASFFDCGTGNGVDVLGAECVSFP